MAFNQPFNEPQHLELNGKTIKRVEDFQYLGSRMASSETDFKRRIALAWSAFWDMEKIWRAKHIPTQLKKNIFKTSVVSVLLYGPILYGYYPARHG